MNTDELLLSTIINSIPYFIFWKNREGIYLGTNDLFAKSAGFSNAQEIVGKTDYDCCWTKEESDFYRSIDKKVMDNDEPILNIEEPQKQLNGETRILLTSKVPLKNSKGEIVGVLGIYTDITSRIELEQEKEKAIRELKDIQLSLIHNEKMRSLGEMAGGIAHEINNPLAIIDGFCSSSLKVLKSNVLDRDKLVSNVEKIRETVKRIGNIVKSLRKISRDEEKEASEIFNVCEVLQDVIALCSEKFRSEGIKVENMVTTECLVNFSRIALSQALLNLLLNGRDAMVEANSQEKVLYLKGFPSDKYFHLEVSDSGPGISEEILPNIFVPFFTTKPVGEGTGIGLSISKSMIENQGGKMKLKNHKPSACFEILIPLEEV